jgi:hypothetical protein
LFISRLFNLTFSLLMNLPIFLLTKCSPKFVLLLFNTLNNELLVNDPLAGLLFNPLIRLLTNLLNSLQVSLHKTVACRSS